MTNILVPQCKICVKTEVFLRNCNLWECLTYTGHQKVMGSVFVLGSEIFSET